MIECKLGHGTDYKPDECTYCKGLTVRTPRGVPARLKPLPCIYLGEPTGREVECPSCENRKVRLKTMTCAIHGECLPAKQVKGVKSCVDCAEKVERQPPRPPGIIVPQPPPLNLTPLHSRAVVTVVVGDEAEQCFATSGPYMRNYADEHGADFVVLRWDGNPNWPMSAKFAIATALDHYERIAYVDADVLLRPGCFDLFDACNPDEFGAVDELAHHRSQPQHGLEKSHLQFRRDMGFRDVPYLPWYLNLGVMVVPKMYRDLLLPPTQPIVKSHAAEQDHTNAKLLDAFLDGKAKVRLIDRRANWQNWTDAGFKSATPDAILHWSGAGKNRVKRDVEMAEWAGRFPVDPKSWEIDARHRDWIRDELMTGKYRRVLEIGSYRGYSTAAFLDALNAGKVDEIHLCDTSITHELRQLVGDLPGVKLHKCRSVDLLAKDAAFDLVFVDGDHTLEVIQAETPYLVGVPAIFAHDTNSTAVGYPNCEGPPYLKAALIEAGYTITEDCERRPGELTHRGMMFATR